MARLASLLPDVLALASARERVRSDRVVATGMRLGGIFAWSVEQARFSQELLGSSAAKNSWQASFPRLPLPSLAGIRITHALPTTDATIASYQGTSEAGEPLRVLVSRSAERETIDTDVQMAEQLVKFMPRQLSQISKQDLTQLIEDVAAVALVEASLTDEADGLRLGAASGWLEAPRLVSHQEDLLVETDLAGIPFHQLSAAQRHAAYREAVLGWARMLLTDGILQVGLRRDRLLVQDGRPTISRWAGTRRAQEGSVALVRGLLLSAFGATAPIRSQNRQRVSALLADGLGLAGDLTQIEAFCLSLVSEGGRLERSRWHLSGTVVRERSGYTPGGRTDVLLLVRQLVWIRDLGLESGVEDLTVPWRELTLDLSCS